MSQGATRPKVIPIMVSIIMVTRTVRYIASVPCQDVIRPRNISTMENIIMDIPANALLTVSVPYQDATRRKSINTMENVIMDIPMVRKSIVSVPCQDVIR